MRGEQVVKAEALRNGTVHLFVCSIVSLSPEMRTYRALV